MSGKTWEELWAAHPRDTPEGIWSFWREIGAWATFRQAVRHRHRSFRFVLRRLQPWDRVLEYGAGIAPVSWWLAHHAPWPLRLTVTDVPSEHMTFGLWRLGNYLVQSKRVDHRITEIRGLSIQPKEPPLQEQYDAVTILETLEHLEDPLQTIEHLTEHLKPCGWLFEDFTPHAAPEAADLSAAQAERPGVYAFLSTDFRLVDGQHWAVPGGGGTRIWQKC